MSKISKVYARQVIDSRGNPTIEVEVSLRNGIVGKAIVPSGSSKGQREALELRDNDKNIWNGMSVNNAIRNINTIIAPKIVGKKVYNLFEIDQIMIELDGTKNKSNLGANAILGVSMAVVSAGAKNKKIPLWKYINSLSKEKIIPSMPVPMLNVLNGGAHSNNNVDFQEYMLFPLGAPNFKESIRWSAEVFHKLSEILDKENFSTSKGDEGGFAPNLKDNEEPLKYIVRAIKEANYIPGKDFFIALDPAASEFYNKKTKKYELKSENKELTSKQMINYYKNLVKKYPIISIEDGMDEQDFEGFKELTKVLGEKIQIVGDDVFVTNYEILKLGIDENIANSILIKINQIGTISETIKTIELAKANGYSCITSHRSGETEDTFISDFCVGMDTRQIKTGSLSRSERVAKYNQLLRISEKIDKFYGLDSLNLEFIKN